MEWHDQNMINSYFNLAIKKKKYVTNYYIDVSRKQLIIRLFIYIFFDKKKNKKIWYTKKVHKKKEIKINKKQE